jgi:hypothetical protein
MNRLPEMPENVRARGLRSTGQRSVLVRSSGCFWHTNRPGHAPLPHWRRSRYRLTFRPRADGSGPIPRIGSLELLLSGMRILDSSAAGTDF